MGNIATGVRVLCKGGIHSFTTPSECYNLGCKDHAWMHPNASKCKSFMVGVPVSDCIQYRKNEMRREVMKTTAGSVALPHMGGKKEHVMGCN